MELIQILDAQDTCAYEYDPSGLVITEITYVHSPKYV